MGGVVRHIAFFRTTTHRGLETFQLMLQSEDMGLDGLLRHNIRSTTKLDIVETKPDSEVADKQIVIFDCRRHFPDLNNAHLPQLSAAYSNIALIEPEPSNRHDAFMIGFADYLSWPVLASELYARILAQCRAQSLKDPQYRYSRVVLVERCCAYMVSNITEDISVRALAQMFNTNHNTLNAMFKREMGLPPSAWQRKVRLEGAARQLRLTNTPVSVIAADFGYDLPSNFATAFRRHFGMTPHHYRKTELRKS
ncbi:helix-turn-helix transcriptional regulator [Agrobacterium rhizogenes]|uniref:helix-turn-helix transcriptional regulator n=2 Tax=Rhizobium rhizogenes TaxID=359 RepID=UPI0015739D46|nr:AraC family transcriptional regulator [Rhizobium rhizogenes]NTH03537.1 helix-turn-helix transcriptional regulator [Rhizobium rhizogenes]